MNSHAVRLLAAASLFVACTPAGAPFPTSLDTNRVIEENSAEAYALLSFLNDPATTEELLDDDVALDRRAAESIIAHRNGPDGKLGIGQDNLFDTVAEVDACYFVGNSAFEKLLAWIEMNEPIPGAEDIVGTWDGVSFTLEETEATLFSANEATEHELDVVMGLDSRAVTSILAARDIETMEALSGLYYVGGSALSALRDWGMAQLADPGAGEGGSCITTDDCAEGLICLGEYRYDEGIFCVDESMAGTFTNDTDSGAIPDPGVFESPVLVSGLASVPVDIIVTIELDHPSPSDLIVTLHDPNGDVAQVWNQAHAPASEVVIRNGIPGDDAVNGTWTLRVEDVVSGQAGTFTQWSLYVVSNWD